ncbi:MAG TPA: hypothetical protein VK446_15070 [Methylocystis sp.]|nr:hypothetical protein [Methylocystis sp.]HXZ18191.1 hypothetical protein [Roseiarcus sp.]
MRKVKALAICLIVCHAARVGAQELDCRFTQGPDQVLICERNDLLALDAKANDLYFSLKDQMGGTKLGLFENVHDYWISQRENCGANAPCIKGVYGSWMREMRRIWRLT